MTPPVAFVSAHQVGVWLLGGEAGPDGTLVWTSGDALIVGAAAIALVAWLLAMRGARSTAARVGEGALLGLGLVGLLIALAGPVWVEEEGRAEPGRVAVLVDASASMSVLEDGAARSAAVAGLLASLGDEHVEVLHYGSALAPGVPSAYDLPGTDLETALSSLADRFAGERLAGVVLLTDGIDRGLLRRGWKDGTNPLPPTLPGPLTIAQVGKPGDLVDLAVREVDAGGYAYVHAPFTITAHLEGIGFEGREVKVELVRDGAVYTTRTVRIGADGQAQVAFEVTPDRDGRFAWIVQVPEYEDDAVPANNALPVVIRVVRDRIRVLQVAGSPSWDVKFLRRFLKGDPSIDLVSFFILRTKQDNIRRFDENELSLIQFPYQELFTEDLLTFDLVIFQNFDYRPYFEEGTGKLLENLAHFVETEGHGFAMVGGDRSFSLGAYGGTPLGDVLPVRIGADPQPPDLAAFLPALTDAGKRHPVTRLVSDPVENEAWWSRLHTNDGSNLVGDAYGDASVLLTHPTLKTSSGAAMPVLAVREVGAGRTMSLTVDTSWRWSLSEAAMGRGNQAYLRFWKGAIRWLIGDSTQERLTVDTARENYGLGEDVRVVVHARDAGFGPLASAPVHISVQGEVEPIEVDATTDAAGEAVVTFPAAKRGAHRAIVKLGGDGRASEAATVFAVTNRDPELDDVIPDAAYLQWLAQRTNGRYIGPGEALDLLRDPDAGRTVWNRKELPLWRAPALALWFGTFIGLAWIVRRRVGLR